MVMLMVMLMMMMMTMMVTMMIVQIRYQLEEFLGRDERNQEDLESLQLHIQEQEGVIRCQYRVLLLYLCLCCLYLYL